MMIDCFLGLGGVRCGAVRNITLDDILSYSMFESRWHGDGVI
jgi:hypothetical protein